MYSQNLLYWVCSVYKSWSQVKKWIYQKKIARNYNKDCHEIRWNWYAVGINITLVSMHAIKHI